MYKTYDSRGGEAKGQVRKRGNKWGFRIYRWRNEHEMGEKQFLSRRIITFYCPNIFILQFSNLEKKASRFSIPWMNIIQQQNYVHTHKILIF